MKFLRLCTEQKCTITKSNPLIPLISFKNTFQRYYTNIFIIVFIDNLITSIPKVYFQTRQKLPCVIIHTRRNKRPPLTFLRLQIRRAENEHVNTFSPTRAHVGGRVTNSKHRRACMHAGDCQKRPKQMMKLETAAASFLRQRGFLCQ